MISSTVALDRPTSNVLPSAAQQALHGTLGTCVQTATRLYPYSHVLQHTLHGVKYGAYFTWCDLLERMQQLDTSDATAPGHACLAHALVNQQHDDMHQSYQVLVKVYVHFLYSLQACGYESLTCTQHSGSKLPCCGWQEKKKMVESWPPVASSVPPGLAAMAVTAPYAQMRGEGMGQSWRGQRDGGRCESAAGARG